VQQRPISRKLKGVLPADPSVIHPSIYFRVVQQMLGIFNECYVCFLELGIFQ
jgi:hypothetical protein